MTGSSEIGLDNFFVEFLWILNYVYVT